MRPDTVSPSAVCIKALGKQVQLASGPLTILQDIGFEIAAGQVVTLVGASDSGKSTLLSLMAGRGCGRNGNRP